MVGLAAGGVWFVPELVAVVVVWAVGAVEVVGLEAWQPRRPQLVPTLTTIAVVLTGMRTTLARFNPRWRREIAAIEGCNMKPPHKTWLKRWLQA